MPLKYLLPLVVLLLIFQFALRSTHILALDGFVDEGLHIRRSTIVWDFDQNPGRFAHGKVLVYFWLGLFEVQPTQSLAIGRLALALFSLLTGAALYATGKKLHSHKVGLLALALYSVLPFALFFDRMALADSFAAGFTTLVAWRSLYFAQSLKTGRGGEIKPLYKEGIILGILLGLTTLAKLTTGLIPLLPGVAALIYFPWQWKNPQLMPFLRRYFPPLLLAAIIVCLLWSPIVIPAYLARHSEQPFKLVNDMNQRIADAENEMSPWEYLRRIEPTLYTFTSRELWWLLGIALGVVSLAGLRQGIRNSLFLLSWIILLSLLSIMTAQLIRSRYFVPIAAPMMLIFAYALVYLWENSRLTKLVSVGIALGLMVWLVRFALPLNQKILDDPDQIAFDTENWFDYQAGYFLSDEAVRQVARDLESLQPRLIYAPWYICHLTYFQTNLPLKCLSIDTPTSDINRFLRQDLPPGETAYMVFADYSTPFFTQVNGIQAQQLSEYQRARIRRPVSLWALWWE